MNQESFIIPEKFNVAEYFVDRHLKEGRSENIAIECGDIRITYQDLFENVNRFGNGLRQLGVLAGDRVMILLPDTPDFFICFLGSIKIGAVPVPTNTLLDAADYEYFLNDSEAKIIVTDNLLISKINVIPRERLPYLQEIIIAGEVSADEISLSHLLASYPSSLVAETTSKNDAALILYSSGSTGAPKGCVHLQHDMAIAGERYAKEVLEMTEQDKCFSVGKLFFAYGLGNSLFCPLSVGATSVLMPGPPKPENIFNIIEQHHPTLFFSVPSNYIKLITYAEDTKKKFNLSSIRLYTSAGEPLPIRLFGRFKERFNAEILDSIGATELFIFTSNRPGANRPGSSGQLIPTYNAKILNDQGQPVKIGEIGNLIIESDTVCAYYWKQPEKTKRTIDGNWFNTGDRCYQDNDGYIWYIGRADDMFKSSGAWVSPMEVENVLMEQPTVLEVAVVGKKDENELLKPMAYIVLREGFSESSELLNDIQNFTRSRLPKYKCPQWIEYVKQLPRTTTGKLQRFKLRETTTK